MTNPTPKTTEKASSTRRLTRTMVEAIAPNPAREVQLLDDEVAGLSLRIFPKGGRVWYFRYRTRDGQRRRVKVGRYSRDLGPVEARKMAKVMVGELQQGLDPAAERLALRSGHTLATFWEEVYKPHASKRLKASSLGFYEQVFDSHLAPALGKTKLTAIHRADVMRLHRDMRETPYAANHALSVLRAILSHAVQEEAIPGNPASRISRFRETPRERFLTAEEMAALVAALDAAETAGRYSRHALACIRFLLFSGLRKNEAVTLRWDMVDFERRLAHLPDTKGGARKLALTATLEAILRAQLAIRDKDNPFVFPGERADGRLGNVDLAWQAVRKNAKMPALRIHDLRHNAATQGALLGLSAPMLKTMMGHKDQATTARYIHLAGHLDAVHVAADALDVAMREAIEGAKKVVEIGPREAAADAAEGETMEGGA